MPIPTPRMKTDMGCGGGCGGGRRGQTIAQANAARTGARQIPEGSAVEIPLTIGDEGGKVGRYRAIYPVAGLRRGNKYWLTGRGVEALVESGALLDISNVGQQQRQWRVGPYTYTDFQTASRVAAVRNTTPIEVA